MQQPRHVTCCILTYILIVESRNAILTACLAMPIAWYWMHVNILRALWDQSCQKLANVFFCRHMRSASSNKNDIVIDWWPTSLVFMTRSHQFGWFMVLARLLVSLGCQLQQTNIDLHHIQNITLGCQTEAELDVIFVRDCGWLTRIVDMCSIWGGYMQLVYSERDCTCQWILCYLSELVVLEASRAGLYLEGWCQTCALILDCDRHWANQVRRLTQRGERPSCSVSEPWTSSREGWSSETLTSKMWKYLWVARSEMN